jgi:hypothetical protein
MVTSGRNKSLQFSQYRSFRVTVSKNGFTLSSKKGLVRLTAKYVKSEGSHSYDCSL